MKERILSHRSKFFPLRVDLFFGKLRRPSKQTRSHENCLPLKTWKKMKLNPKNLKTEEVRYLPKVKQRSKFGSIGISSPKVHNSGKITHIESKSRTMKVKWIHLYPNGHKTLNEH